MNSPSTDIKDFLISVSGLSILTFGSNLHVGVLPDRENEGIVSALFDYPGSPEDPNNIENTSIQVLTRGEKGGYRNAYTRAKLIESKIKEVNNTKINGTLYVLAWVLSSTYHISNDQRNRPLFSSNFLIKRSV